MANANNNKIIRLYGVTLPKQDLRGRPYGHGATRVSDRYVCYVDYHVSDLIDCIKTVGIEDEIIKKLSKS